MNFFKRKENCFPKYHSVKIFLISDYFQGIHYHNMEHFYITLFVVVFDNSLICKEYNIVHAMSMYVPFVHVFMHI